MAKPKLLTSTQNPNRYEIFINLLSDKLIFEGRVKINLKITKPCQKITLHSRKLKVVNPTIKKIHKKETENFVVQRINYHRKFQEVRLHSDKKLFPGDYEVEMEFSGQITPNMTGLYPCNFEYQGKEKLILATQFESNDAREVFPCIDEPGAKAVFELSLETENKNICLSNMPMVDEQVVGSRKKVLFEETPRMSSYLLAFACGDMHFVEKFSAKGTPVRTWSAVNRPLDLLNYSASEAVKVLDFFEDYFKTDYPLPKLDQLALPDFDAGAMENWGLITYREIALLADEKNRSISNEQYVSLVIAHEISHQWFGNLVTMKWWDDLWLNESFASLMEHIALDSIHPDWKQWEHYTSSDVISTSSRDVYADIQPICVKISDPDLIETLFDPGIVYAKGSRLLKMLRELIGDEAFRSGLEQYFKNNAYSNTSRDDLWVELTKSSGKNIAKIMNPWLLQPGMPVLKIEQAGNTLDITQSRFMLDSAEDDSIWPIPLLANNPTTPDLIYDRSASLKLKSSAFVVLNQYASAHYFSQYTCEDHFNFLKKQFSDRQLSTEFRINLLNDLIMLSKKGLSKLISALDLIYELDHENRDCVWTMISRVISASSQLTEGDENCEVGLKKLKLKLANYNFSLLGVDNNPKDDPNTVQLRHTMFSYMIGGENQKIIKHCLELYKNVGNINLLPAETRSTILSAVVRHSGDNSDIFKLLDQYQSESPDIQLDITSALLCTKDKNLAKDIYKKALGENGFVRPQDLMRWIAIGMRNHHIRDIMWTFIESNWAWIEETIGQSKSFDYLPIYCASTVSKPEELKRFKKIFLPRINNKSLERNIKIGISDAKSKIDWRKRDEYSIQEFLKSRNLF